MSDILTDMLVVAVRGATTETQRFNDKYPETHILYVEAELVGYGIDMSQRFTTEEAPRVGDRINVEL